MKKILVIITLILCFCSCIKRSSARSVDLNNDTTVTLVEPKFQVIFQGTMWVIMYINDSTFLCIPGYNNPATGDENRPRLLQISNGRETKEVIDELS